MVKKRIITMLILVCVSISLISTAMAAQLSDISGHWAGDEIQKWSDIGVVQGYGDGAFLPDNNITRAEFAKIVNNLFGYINQADSAGVDVPESAWYAAEMKKALAAGYLKGYGEGVMAPEGLLTREEAATMLCRVFSIEGSAEIQFTDSGSVSGWAADSVAALSEAGGINGYPDGSFRPSANITRAEVIKIIDNLVAMIIVTPGVYDLSVDGEAGVIEGNLIVAAENVTLKNAVIKGNLYIAPAVGEADADFYNVTVQGGTFIAGGGYSSVSFFGCILANASITKQGAVRVVLEDGTADLIENTSEGSKLELEGLAAVKKVRLMVRTDILLAQDTVIDTLEVTKEAGDTTVAGTGTAANIVTATDDIVVGSDVQAPNITDFDGSEVEVTRGSSETPASEAPAVVLPEPAVFLAGGSKGAAGNGKISGLTLGAIYKVEGGADSGSKTTMYVTAGGALSASINDIGKLTVTEISGLTNYETYKVISATPYTEEAFGEITGLVRNNAQTGKNYYTDDEITVSNGVVYMTATYSALTMGEVNLWNFITRNGTQDLYNNPDASDRLGTLADGKFRFAILGRPSPAYNGVDGPSVTVAAGPFYAARVAKDSGTTYSTFYGTNGVRELWSNLYYVSLYIRTDEALSANPRAMFYTSNGVVGDQRTYIFDCDNGEFVYFDLEVIADNAVRLTSTSLGTAGDGSVTGLASGTEYKVVIGAKNAAAASKTTMYVTADGTLSSDINDLAELVGTEITGLANGTIYEVTVAP